MNICVVCREKPARKQCCDSCRDNFLDTLKNSGGRIVGFCHQCGFFMITEAIFKKLFPKFASSNNDDYIFVVYDKRMCHRSPLIKVIEANIWRVRPTHSEAYLQN